MTSACASRGGGDPVTGVEVVPSSSAPAVVAGSAAGGEPRAERKDPFPNLNLYFPEGEASIRVKKLIRNVLFETQINYNFFDGDVSTFLRYKYYSKKFMYRIGVFDAIEFRSVDTGDNDFDRTRGGLLQFEYPVSYNGRYFLLFQADGLAFGDTTRPDNNKNNNYVKMAYQFGSPFDERMNAIVGESRGRVPPVLTAYREIGPQKFGVAIALTQALESVGGDFQYTKLETEALKRFDLSEASFVISRFHTGSLLVKDRLTTDPNVPPIEQYSVPRYEFFKIGGRGALKGVDSSVRGSDEIHFTNELFFPIFRNRNYKTGPLRWHTLYGIGYLGAGNIGYSSSTYTDISDYAADAGAGWEANLTVRDYDVILSLIYAQTVSAPAELEGDSVRFSVRTSR